MEWPEGFWWGTGASSTQCEGAAPASEWIAWEAAGRAPGSGHGSDFAAGYEQDVALYASLGLTHHRLGIDWSRIEPEPGRRDKAAVAHYRQVLQAAHDCGVHPWVCLLHFVVPQWFADAGDFRLAENRTGAWADHVAFVVDTFGDLVDGWQPVNESNIYPTLKFRGLGFAPGRDDHDEFVAVAENVHLAAAEAAVRLRATGAPVASIFSLFPAIAQDDSDSAASTDRVARDAEYGIGTDDDLRARYLRDGLRITHDALARGIDVRGLFHWTGVDNYEWLFGYDVRFGIVDADRAVRPSARVLAAEALGHHP